MAQDFGDAHGVVLLVPVDPKGLAGPTRRAATGPEWRRSSRGLSMPAYVAPNPIQRVAEVGAILPPHATPTGWASLAWQGGWWFGGTGSDGSTPRPVPVGASGRPIRPQAGFTLCSERWRPSDVVVVDGLPVADAARAVSFEMRYATTVERAAMGLDMATFHDLVSIDEVRFWVDAHATYTGIERARKALVLGDENAWSPQESRLRLFLLERGLGPFLTNRPVFDLDGHHLGTPDLIDPRTGVCAEYDGGLHLTGAQRARDLRREADLRRHGLDTVTMVAADWAMPASYLLRVREAYAEAAARPAERRRWTLELPRWWCPTVTVEQRRALAPDQRRRWLRHLPCRPARAPLR